jgi:hypothetical protein
MSRGAVLLSAVTNVMAAAADDGAAASSVELLPTAFVRPAMPIRGENAPRCSWVSPRNA